LKLFGQPPLRLRLLAPAIALIVAATMIPVGLRHPSLRFIDNSFDPPDIVNNVILYLPLGIALCRSSLRRAFLFGFFLALTAETWQLVCIDRIPSFVDVAGNTAGSVLGYLAAEAFFRLTGKDPKTLWISRPLAAVAVPISIVGTILLLHHPTISDLSNWNPGYHLAIGNELTGDRLWNGSVSRLTIYPFAMSAAQVMQNHISTVCGHYAGKLHSWDVVNEGIDFSSGRPDGLRNSVWLQLLGPDYIAQAFQMARAADPQALLVYNDFGFEYASPDQEMRRRAVLALLTKLKSANVPIQALGLQTHLYAGMTAQFKPAVYQAFLKEVSDLGLKIFITEMDVQDGGLPGDTGARDQQIAGIYSQVLTAALANPAVTVVETWGLADKYSWLQKHAPRKDGLEVRTLPLDDSLQPKGVYDAIGAALDGAPSRSP